ncbi:hypothetical protein [Photobacterium kasasachensis]|uniref:hypothetical protein n=1 Tax=Photobacterium kasasachensis TaxID=2910240 RepID=UPI003D0BD926
MQNKHASTFYSGIKPICGLVLSAALFSSFSVQAYNKGMPAPGAKEQAELSQENSQASYYLKYKPDMKAQAKSLVTKLGGTITDTMPERRVLIVSLDKSDVDNLTANRKQYSDIIDYVEINPQRQLLEKKTSLSY